MPTHQAIQGLYGVPNLGARASEFSDLANENNYRLDMYNLPKSS